MGWLRDNVHWVLLACFVVGLVATVGVGLLALVAALGALSPTSVAVAEEFVLLRMLEAALPYLVPLVVLGILDVVLLVGTVVAALSKASLPRSDRLSSLAERAEREYPVLAVLDVSDRVEPTVEDRRRELREQYVAGEIGEREFERRMGELLDEEDDDPLSNDPDYAGDDDGRNVGVE
jgi:hypothetical protein